MQEKKEMFFVFSRNFAIIKENICRFFVITLPETNIFAPENGWLEYFLISFWGPAYFQGRTGCWLQGGYPAFAVGRSGTGRV